MLQTLDQVDGDRIGALGHSLGGHGTLFLAAYMDISELQEAPQNFGFYVHGRGHSVAHESRKLMYGWMDAHLKPPEATQTRLVPPELETAAPADSR